jgi:hypothetical protein
MSNDPQFEHPRGTVAIVFIFGALFALGWFAMSRRLRFCFRAL